jgi:hypothetical protein
MVMRLRVHFHLTGIIEILADQQGFSVIHDREAEYCVCLCVRVCVPRVMMRGEFVLILVVVKGRKEEE